MSTKRSPSVEFVRRISPPKGRIRRTPTPHPKKRSRSRSPSPEVQYIKTVKKPAKSPQHITFTKKAFSPENGVMQYKEIRPRLFLENPKLLQPRIGHVYYDGENTDFSTNPIHPSVNMTTDWVIVVGRNGTPENNDVLYNSVVNGVPCGTNNVNGTGHTGPSKFCATSI